MNWKQENPKPRYIDSITREEAQKIAWLALGKPDIIEITDVNANCNGNNMPHVKIFCNYYDRAAKKNWNATVGIFSSLDTYMSIEEESYMAECQRELFEAYKEMGLS